MTLTDQQSQFLAKYLGFSRADPTTDATRDIVRKRGFLITRWQTIPAEITAEIGALIRAIERKLPHEDATGFSRALELELRQRTDSMQTRISEAIDSAVNSGDRRYATVVSAIDALRGSVRSDPLIAKLRSNAVLASPGFEKTYLSALDEVEQMLSA